MPKFSPYSDTIRDFSGRNNLSTTNSDIINLMRSNGIYDMHKLEWYNKFMRIPGVDPNNSMTVTKEYVFFTKPDLHLINVNTNKVANSLNKYPFFVDAVDRYRPVCEQLQLSVENRDAITNTRNPFITLLSNRLRSGLDLPSIDADNEQETGANVYGTKISYRGNSYTSDQEHTFSLEFEDTKYLEVYMFFKIYDEYCKYKNMGLIELDPDDSKSSNDDLKWINYTKNKVLHDQFSAYKFVVGEDGMTLVYWAKLTGVYPTNVPRDAFDDMSNQEGQKLTVNFKAQFVRDMDPTILSEFNRIALKADYYKNKSEMPLFNSTTKMIDGEWSSMPFIKQINGNSEIEKMMRYKLVWKK